MPAKKVTVGVEVTPKKAFASALDWPGWTRAGKTPEAALEALAASAPRYAKVAKKAKLDFPFDGDVAFDVVEEAEGNATTAFGAPDVRFEADHRRTTAKDGERLAALVAASYAIFDAVVGTAPPTLRKGPRGGGRDRDRIVEQRVG